jgi:hypothetical protein
MVQRFESVESKRGGELKVGLASKSSRVLEEPPTACDWLVRHR